jgi:hypothetical protein
MRRLGPLDGLLLATLLPVWVLTFGLHVREVVRSELAQPAFFVSMPEHSGAYPRVRGFRIEQPGGTGDLQIGDRLIRLGDVDLRGFGNIGVDAVAIAQAGVDRRFPLVFERDGRAVRTEASLAASPVPWMRIPVLFGAALVAVVVLLRATRSARPRLLYLAFMVMAIAETPFHGESPAQTYASKLLFYSLLIAGPPLVLSWAMRFCDDSGAPPRASAWVPWLFIPVYAFTRANYMLDGPLSGEVAPKLGPIADGLLVVAVLTALTYNYLRASPVHRRRVKWLLFGAYVGFAPSTIVFIILPILEPQLSWYSNAVALAFPLTVAFPLALLVGIVRQRLFDIDRILSATASYTALAVVVVAGALTVIPRTADVVSGSLGFDPAAGQLVFTALLAVVVVPAHRRIRPQIDRLFFPERHSLEVGVQDLLAETSIYGHPRELVRGIAERLDRKAHRATCAMRASSYPCSRGGPRRSPTSTPEVRS